MALLRDLSASQLAFQVAGGRVDQFQVVRYRGTEGLCQLYRFELDLVSSDTVDFSTIVGQSAVLSINATSGERFFHGIVSRFELAGDSDDECRYRAELVPTFWLLTHRYHSRIFQEKSVRDIVTEVLTQGGLQSDRFRFELSGTYEPREYCVQYRETDFNFVCRLLEEEGIWWYFEQVQDGHVLVMADAPAAYRPIEGEPELIYREPSGLAPDEDHVFRFRLSQAVRPGAVVLDDFDFKNPKLDLKSQADSGNGKGFSVSDYPGGYTKQNRGQKLASVRIEELQTGRILGLGQSTCQRLSPAHKFSLTEHPVEMLNAEYLVTQVTHQGKQSVRRTRAGSNGRAGLLSASVQQSLLVARQDGNERIRELADALLQLLTRFQTADPTAHRTAAQWLLHAGQVTRDLAAIAAAGGGNPLDVLSIPNLIEDVLHSSIVDTDAPVYECRFECIPAEVSFRPPRVTPWPVMRGSQTALVVGPAGEEIHTDEYGRVKVQFHWDREGKYDDKASCWIRVSQGFAGGQYGILFLPRVGQEVVVDFLEGNPDKPLIVGRVFNADHMPPYKLPDEKTKSVIKTRSTKGGGGANEIRFEDLKGKEQILFHAQKDLHVRVKNDRVETVEKDHHETVEGGRFELVKKAVHSEITLDVNEKIGGAVSRAVTGNVAEEFKSKHYEKVGADYYLKAGGQVVIEAASGITLKVGGNFVKIDASGVTILGTMVKINSGGGPGSGSPVALKAPEKPSLADKVEPGKDVRYSGGDQLETAQAPPELKGHEFKVSWIEIELVDEAGQPVVGESIELIDSEGNKHGGTTGHDGIANILIPKQGNCQISFPNLDAAAWERLG